MYPWISRTLDFGLQFCEKKCGVYMDVYGTSLLQGYCQDGIHLDGESHCKSNVSWPGLVPRLLILEPAYVNH